MPKAWDNGEYDLSLEDRIASMIMATIYSHDHINFTIALKSERPKRNDKAGMVAKLTAARDEEFRTESELRAAEKFEGEFLMVHPPEGQLIFRVFEDEKEKTNVSDDSYDTTAVAIVDSTIYVATNYKVRKMPNERLTTKSEPIYIAYGPPSMNARSAAVATLEEELWLDEITGVSKVSFLGVDPPPVDPDSNAAPHAEMQLIRYLGRKALKADRIGVSKACCIKCKDALDDIGVPYTQRNGNSKPRNWQPPSEFVVKEIEERRIRT